ncbi:MAG: hypothetical protein AAGF36_00310 [Pseudomonadota bacterium]
MKKTIACLSAIYVFCTFEAMAASDCIQPENQCTPVVGCILGDPNELFIGEVVGVGQGVFAIKSTKGARCVGTFKRTVIGTVRVKATCEDGRSARATFSYFHERTGTGRGKGRMSDGEEVIFWAGDRLFSYFQNPRASEPNKLVVCGKNALEGAG